MPDRTTQSAQTWPSALTGVGPDGMPEVAEFTPSRPPTYLASDHAKDVTGQIFGVRGKEIMLFGHMRPVMRIHHADGWTGDRIAEMFPGTLQHHLVPLETSGQYFNYDPLV